MDSRDTMKNDQRLAALLGSIPETDMPGGLAQRILAKAQRTTQTRRITGYRELVIAWWSEATPALRAAAVFMLVAGFSLGTAMSLEVTRQIAEADHLTGVYGLDNFSGTSEGSLEQAYLTLSESPNGGGR